MQKEVGIHDGEADDSNYTLCLTGDFDALEDLKRDAIDSHHLEVATFIGKIKINRACVDYVLE